MLYEVITVNGNEFVIADIPGLIEGAHEGAGLGDRFLGHVERTSVLLHLVDATAEDVAESYEIIRGELEAYGGGLDEKPEIVGLNKVDALTEDDVAEKLAALKAVTDSPVMALSGVSGYNLQGVLRTLASYVWDEPAKEEDERDKWAPLTNDED